MTVGISGGAAFCSCGPKVGAPCSPHFSTSPYPVKFDASSAAIPARALNTNGFKSSLPVGRGCASALLLNPRESRRGCLDRKRYSPFAGVRGDTRPKQGERLNGSQGGAVRSAMRGTSRAVLRRERLRCSASIVLSCLASEWA